MGVQRSRIVLRIARVQSHGIHKDRLCVALLLELVLKRLLEFLELHHVAFVLKEGHDLI